jgi:hypothetical protein
MDLLVCVAGLYSTYKRPNNRHKCYKATVADLTPITELCYQFMYVEPSGRPHPRDPWSFRQTGVEHRYESTTNRNLIVLLHNNDESSAQERLEKHANSSERYALAAHPLNVHLVIISSYMVHWQDHIENLARSLQDIVRVMMM